MIDGQQDPAAQAVWLGDEDELPVGTGICNSIIWMSHLIERYANARLPSFGLPPSLTMPRVRLLLAVASGAAQATSTRMSDIALDLGVTARTITTMVDALEAEELVERVPDPNDRRAISLVLTERGEAAVPAIQAALDEISAAVVAPLGGDEQDALHTLLTRLIERDTGE
jgi:DNA-binding MarR family transcriptional regulator